MIFIFLNKVIAIAANKSDMYEVEEVAESEGRDCAKEINAIFKYTSAKNNIGVQVRNITFFLFFLIFLFYFFFRKYFQLLVINI